MTMRQVIALLFGGTLAIAIVWALGEKSLSVSFGEMIRDPWGIVTLIDLYSGFVAFALVVAYFERPLVAGLLFIALCVLGNVVSLGWLAFRGFRLIQSRMVPRP